MFDAGVGQHVQFDHVCRSFAEQIRRLPEFNNIEVSYDHRKGGTVHVVGSVRNKDVHDQLIDMTHGVILSQKSNAGISDRISYPEKKPLENEPATIGTGAR